MSDAFRRRLAGHLNANATSRKELELTFGQVWDTRQLEEDFEVLQFKAPLVVVKRRSDGILGSLLFQHAPRYYWGWEVNDG